MSTIYWSPPLCDASCTVSVDGQDIDTVPCGNGNLTVSGDPDLSTRTLSINATDPFGRSVLVQNNFIEGTSCV